MKKKYKFITLSFLSLAIIGVIIYGVFYLETTLSNVEYSRNAAHTIALKQFPGTIMSSKVDYEHQEIYYELIIQDKNQQMIDVEVSAKSGQISGFAYED